MHAVAESQGKTGSALKGGTSKVARYGWKVVDKTGEFAMLNKHVLKVDHQNYQREPKHEVQINQMSSEWSWVSCGTLIVALREDGDYWIVDGQHRWRAAMKRADINELPCLLFECSSIKQEATGFLRVNTARRPLHGSETFKARVAAEDPTAIAVSHMLALHGYTVSKSPASGSARCVSLLFRLAAINAESLNLILAIYERCLDKQPLHNRVVHSLWHLHEHGDLDLSNSRVHERIKKVGHDELIAAINKAAAYYAHGGVTHWSKGVRTALNRGLRNRICAGDEE